MYIRFLGTQNPSILLSLASHSIVLYCLILCHFDLCLFMSFSIVMIVVMDRASWSVLVLFLVQGSGLLFSGRLGPPPPGPWIFLESSCGQTLANIGLWISLDYWNYIHIYMSIFFSHFITSVHILSQLSEKIFIKLWCMVVDSIEPTFEGLLKNSWNICRQT